MDIKEEKLKEMEIIAKPLPNQGVVEVQLSKGIIDNFWKLIDDPKNEKKDYKPNLAGNIKASYELNRESPLLADFYNFLPQIVNTYQSKFTPEHRISHFFKGNDWIYGLETLWVNFQRKHEFNPMHDHAGVFSFVIWMKIPTSHVEQKELPLAKNSNSTDSISNFSFVYTDVLGSIKNLNYNMEKDMCGYMVMFPSSLHHMVNPFYECDEERISISGNIGLMRGQDE